MKQNFIDKGIPVMLGEYATWRRNASLGKTVTKDLDMHNKSVNYRATYVTKQAKAYGHLPFWWEIGFMLDSWPMARSTTNTEAVYEIRPY